jgi:hypothetical protein
MGKIISVIKLNFIQGVREKLFWQAVFFFVFILGLTFFMGILSVGQTAAVLKGFGLSAIELSALVLTVTSLVFNFYRERDCRLTEFLLSCFSRPDYISGKLGGYILLVLFYVILTGSGWIVLLIFNQAFTVYALAGLFTIFLKVAIIASFALVFSCLFTSYIMSLTSAFFVYIAAEVSPAAVKIVSQSSSSALKYFFKFVYYILPNMDKLDIKSGVVYGQIPAFGFFAGITLYSVIYVILLWSLATYIFIKKEI